MFRNVSPEPFGRFAARQNLDSRGREHSGQSTVRRPGASGPESIPVAPYLFLVLSCEPPVGAAARFCLADVDEIIFRRSAQAGSTHILEGNLLELHIGDASMSSTHARLERRVDDWLLVDADSTNGSMVNGVRVSSAILRDGDMLELGQTFFLFRAALPHDADREASHFVSATARAIPGLTTLSPIFARDLERLRAIAPSGLSVLIRGESGTGKELVARALHALSGRKGPFVAVNCAALPPTLVESELFGYRKGAFSGAVEDRLGLIRSAESGTLFLDEIGDLPLPAQAALLRVLQEREVTPLGATRPISVDVRCVAATHRDLESMVRDGAFRADLLARLDGWSLRVPPLRERREDLGLLADAVLARATTVPVGLGWEVVRALLQYAWPLNIRELEQALSAAAILSRGTIRLEHLPGLLRQAKQAIPTAEAKPPASACSPIAPSLSPGDQRRRLEIIALFDQHRGNVAAVARAMGKAPIQVRRWAKRYGIELTQYRR
jgi:transcriptional regulator with GAF, ATPase, and Fis domain